MLGTLLELRCRIGVWTIDGIGWLDPVLVLSRSLGMCLLESIPTNCGGSLLAAQEFTKSGIVDLYRLISTLFVGRDELGDDGIQKLVLISELGGVLSGRHGGNWIGYQR